MRLREKIIGICIAALLLILTVCLALRSCQDLLGDFKGGISAPPSLIPFPVVLLLAFFPLASLLLAAFLVLRSLAKVKRRESEEEKEDEDY